MSETKKYTVIDIEKYYKGQLTPAEMNALEKAALDDPFFADAIEGYKISAVNSTSEINELKQRLTQRIENVSEKKGRLIAMPWLRAAAMIIFIAGAGLLIYQFAFNDSKKDIAKLEEKSVSKNVGDSTAAGGTVTLNTPVAKEADKPAKKESDQKGSFEVTTVNNGKQAVELKNQVKEDLVKTEQPVTVQVEDAKQDFKSITPAQQKNEEKVSALAKEGQKEKLDERKITAAKDYDKVETSGYGIKRAEQNRQLQANSFRGRVTDLNNNPVPFANITNRRDNTATYSDVNGNFNLISPDSILDVRVSSVGYELNNARLLDVRENQVVLQDDKNALAEVVVNNTRSNAAQRSMMETKKVQGPEPVDGWQNYDAYLLNNIQIPVNIKASGGGEVRLSFEVNKNGSPVDIKIETSLCSECDKEAIRLIKEGPKWKRTSKKARAFVTVPFISNR